MKLKTASWCCGVDMGDSCIYGRIKFPDRKVYKRYPMTSGPGALGAGDECGDCGTIAKDDSYHHTSCDQEICPRCGGQMLACDCPFENYTLVT